MNDKIKKISKLWYFFATGFRIGTISNHFIPVGTIASIAAIPIWWIILYFCSYKGYLVFLIFSIIMGIYCCDKTTKIIGIHDHRSIVLDEFIGMWITLTVIPDQNSGIWIFLAFLLFRILDIIKPWPISWCDSVIKGGFGIVIDDILASLLTICILICLMNFFFK